MDQIVPFLMQHWVLTAAFIAILIAIMIFEMREQATGFQQLTPGQAVDLINHQKAVVIDCRDKAFFVKGHIIHAVNISKADLEANTSKLTSLKSNPIILLGQSGDDVAPLAGKLRKQGYEVKVLSGGIEKWRSANLPLEK